MDGVKGWKYIRGANGGLILLVLAAVFAVSCSSNSSSNPPTLQSISVTPANPSIAKGTTEQFKATGTFSDQSTQDITTSATWSSDTPGVATVSNAAGSQGLATSASTGSAKIQASLNSVSGSTKLTVTSAVVVSIAVTPANQTIAQAVPQPFTATATFSDQSTQNVTSSATWNSTQPSIASVSATGVVTGQIGRASWWERV